MGEYGEHHPFHHSGVDSGALATSPELSGYGQAQFDTISAGSCVDAPTPFDWQGKWPRVRRVKDGVIKVFNYAGGLDEYAIGDFVYSEWTGPDGHSLDCWEIIGREQDDDDFLDDYYIKHKGGPDHTECIPTPTPVI